MDDENQEQYMEIVEKDGDMYKFVLPVRAYFQKTGNMTVTCLELPFLKDLSASEITRRVKVLYKGEYGDWFPVSYVISKNTIMLPFAYKEVRLDYLHWMNENLFACEGKVHITLHPKNPEIVSSESSDNTSRKTRNISKTCFQVDYFGIVLCFAIILLVVMACCYIFFCPPAFWLLINIPVASLFLFFIGALIFLI